MSFLCVLGFGCVGAGRRRQIGFAIGFKDGVAGCCDALRCYIHTISSHIGDEAYRITIDIDALVKALGHLHGFGRRKAQFARCFLLQCGRAERRIGVALGRFAFYAVNRYAGILQRLLDGAGRGFILDIKLGDFLPGYGLQGGRKLLAGRRGKGAFNGPVFLAFESFNLQFAVANDAQGHRLHPPRRP